MIVKRLIDKGFWFSKTNSTIRKSVELLINTTNGTLATDNQQLQVIDYNIWLAVKALYPDNKIVEQVSLELEQKDAAIENDGFNIQLESTYNASVEIERARRSGNEKREAVLMQFGYPAYYIATTADELEGHIYDEIDLLNFLRSSEWLRKKGILSFEDFSIEKDNKDFVLKSDSDIVGRYDAMNDAIIEAGRIYYYNKRKENLQKAYSKKSSYYYPEKKSPIEAMIEEKFCKDHCLSDALIRLKKHNKAAANLVEVFLTKVNAEPFYNDIGFDILSLSDKEMKDTNKIAEILNKYKGESVPLTGFAYRITRIEQLKDKLKSGEASQDEYNELLKLIETAYKEEDYGIEGSVIAETLYESEIEQANELFSKLNIKLENEFKTFLAEIDVKEYKEQGVPYSLYQLSHNGEDIIKGIGFTEKEANLDFQAVSHAVKMGNSGIGLMEENFKRKVIALLPERWHTYTYFKNEPNKINFKVGDYVRNLASPFTKKNNGYITEIRDNKAYVLETDYIGSWGNLSDLQLVMKRIEVEEQAKKFNIGDLCIYKGREVIIEKFSSKNLTFHSKISNAGKNEAWVKLVYKNAQDYKGEFWVDLTELSLVKKKDDVLLNIHTEITNSKPEDKLQLFSNNEILPLLYDKNPNGNVFLKELRLNKIPYARVIDIISSVGALNTENVFVRDILNYGKREFAELDIINNSKDYYLSQPYFNNFPAELKDEWYKNHFKNRIGEYISIARSSPSDIIAQKLNLRFEEAGIEKRVPTASIRKKILTLNNILNSSIARSERPAQIEKEANENLSNEKHQQFVVKMLEHIEMKTKFSNKTQVENIGKEYGIIEPYKVKELAEFAIVKYARKLAHQKDKTRKQKFFEIVNLYETQVNLTHRTNISIQLQQYSTPATIGFLMGIYCGLENDGLYFEPSAGNGLLTIAGKESNFIVNELDVFRYSNLAKQGYKKTLNVDATKPFPEFEKQFDAIITNPPFGNAENVIKVNDYSIKSLEQQMVIIALDCLKDSGKAAFIIGGHLEYDSEGRIKSGKNSIFFNWLWKHYIVDDVINIDGYSLYRKQGTAYDTRIVLIGGRQSKARKDYFPILNEKISQVTPFSHKPIKDFENLYNRFANNFQ
jgi:hypothetical protein